MKKFVFSAVAALICVFGINQNAFGQPILGERTIQKLPPPGKDAKIDKFRCGDYFLFGPPGPRIGFVMEREKGDLEGIVFTGAFLPENIEVIIDDSLLVPKVKIMASDAPDAQIKVVVRISQVEYERCSCLSMTKFPPKKKHTPAAPRLKILEATHQQQ